MVQLSHPYMSWKTIALTVQTFVDEVTSLLLNMLRGCEAGLRGSRDTDPGEWNPVWQDPCLATKSRWLNRKRGGEDVLQHMTFSLSTVFFKLVIFNHFYILALQHGMWGLSSLTRVTPVSLQWKPRVLTTRPPGESQQNFWVQRSPRGPLLVWASHCLSQNWTWGVLSPGPSSRTSFPPGGLTWGQEVSRASWTWMEECEGCRAVRMGILRMARGSAVGAAWAPAPFQAGSGVWRVAGRAD